MPFLRRKNERCALEKMGKQRKSPPQARLLPATWRLLPATAATKRLDFCGEGRRLDGQGLGGAHVGLRVALAETLLCGSRRSSASMEPSRGQP